MYSLNTHKSRMALGSASLTLGVLSLVLIAYGFTHGNTNTVSGLLLPKYMPQDIKWNTITAPQVQSGTTVPANMHNVFTMPTEATRTTRRVLFGRRGETIRYWGYCFPKDLHAAANKTRRGFPGDIFLSEKEREHRRKVLIEQRRRTFSIFRHLTEEDLNEARPEPRSRIRHQKEVFEAGEQCYIMTEKSIPIGIDTDGDTLNNALERGFGSDSKNPDTDGDGITDGLEVFRMGSHPTKRDSDGDNIIDGIEDANRNGRFDIGETHPTEWDTDKDGLCDGLCKDGKGQVFGEDKNLNGIYEPDLNEYDPRRVDSDGDGVLDEHEVYLCIIGGGDDC